MQWTLHLPDSVFAHSKLSAQIIPEPCQLPAQFTLQRSYFDLRSKRFVLFCADRVLFYDMAGNQLAEHHIPLPSERISNLLQVKPSASGLFLVWTHFDDSDSDEDLLPSHVAFCSPSNLSFHFTRKNCNRMGSTPMVFDDCIVLNTSQGLLSWYSCTGAYLVGANTGWSTALQNGVRHVYQNLLTTSDAVYQLGERELVTRMTFAQKLTVLSACQQFVLLFENASESSIRFYYLDVLKLKLCTGPLYDQIFSHSSVTSQGIHLAFSSDDTIEVYNMKTAKRIWQWRNPVEPAMCKLTASVVNNVLLLSTAHHSKYWCEGCSRKRDSKDTWNFNI